LEPLGAATAAALAPEPRPGKSLPGKEALQALLAFSALHEQVREKQARQKEGITAAEDSGQLEQFVLDEVLQLVAERARTITGADGVAIALAENDAIVCRASAGKIVPDAGVRLDPHSGFSGACLSSGNVVRCDDSDTDDRVNPEACRRLGARSMVAVPLSAKQTVIGLLEAFSSDPYGFNDSDIRSLNLLAELILSALRPQEEDRLAEISRQVIATKITPPVEIDTAPVAPVVAEEAEPNQSTEQSLPSSFAAYGTVDNSRPGLKVVVALVVFAIGLGTALWWNIRRHSIASTSHPIVVTPTPPTATPQAASATSAPAVEPATLPEEETNSEPPVALPNGPIPQITGIRHWSSSDSSTVVIDLQDQVQYEAHRLTNPERIYFDLHDTRLAANISSKPIEVGDELLQKIRAAQSTQDVTRVVLETKGASNFSVSMETNPYRLVVEVRKIGAKPQSRANVDLFGPISPTETAAPAPAVAGAPPPLTVAKAPRLRIALDAGHGGWDLGTVGRKGLLEKDLVLDIVARLGKMVESRLGAEVIYTRKDDSYIPLEKRAEIANLERANFLVSIHANYSDYPSARGVETYYTDTYSSVRARLQEEDGSDPALQKIDWTKVDIREKVTDSRRLAADVQHTLYSKLAVKTPELRNRGVKQAQYVVLTGTSMPAVLAEVSFVSSPTDENNLQSSAYRQQIAQALFEGIARYAKESSHVTLASVGKKSAAR
jgi:N-acetylmuramoyl-L-alanine amidase/putative methionine-R-sulfoxide reductase with GAF domain